MPTGYEAFFGLSERPFSLTPDPRFFFESCSHGSVRQALIDALDRVERFVLVTGDLGTGKTLLCRTVVPCLRSRLAVSYIANPLLTPSGLFRLLLEDFGAFAGEKPRPGDAGATAHDLREMLVKFLARLRNTGRNAVVIIDEAHTLPLSVVEHLLLLGGLDPDNDRPLQMVLVGQPLIGASGATGVRALNQHVSTTAHLAPLTKDECADYVARRLEVAGAGDGAVFAPGAIDMLYGLSGGIPRLINLLAERALQDAAHQRTRKISPGLIDTAAAALELLRGTPRRFRWFSRRVS